MNSEKFIGWRVWKILCCSKIATWICTYCKCIYKLLSYSWGKKIDKWHLSLTIIIRQWINFIGNSHHFHEYRWIIFHFTFIVHIYTVVFIILLNTSDNLFYVCVVNICCEYTCKIYMQCCCVKIMLLKSSHVECVPKSASALWIIVPFCCWQSLPASKGC